MILHVAKHITEGKLKSKEGFWVYLKWNLLQF